MKTITVNADALRQLLQALIGPGHHLRELQATRGLITGKNNPINLLIEEYNAAAEKHNRDSEGT